VAAPAQRLYCRSQWDSLVGSDRSALLGLAQAGTRVSVRGKPRRRRCEHRQKAKDNSK
jgi:hypothetical protein